MTGKTQKARLLYQEEGLPQLANKTLEYAYNRLIRDHLPRKETTYNGVVVKGRKPLDSVSPWHQSTHPKYEDAICESLREHVKEGDSVTVVGGGLGVSAVVSAQQVGSEGIVSVFEGGEKQVAEINETIEANHVADRVEVTEAIVGELVHTRTAPSENYLDPENLPPADVVELDCEGAELDILEKMVVQPRVLIVETHGIYNAPKNEVMNKVESLGYDIFDVSVAEPSREKKCEREGIYVLTAVDPDQR